MYKIFEFQKAKMGVFIDSFTRTLTWLPVIGQGFNVLGIRHYIEYTSGGFSV